tara:strand:+ start:229 stop:459 length:231 start_codon:yes stop_codon:yes gene_type:complete
VKEPCKDPECDGEIDFSQNCINPEIRELLGGNLSSMHGAYSCPECGRLYSLWMHKLISKPPNARDLFIKNGRVIAR